MRTIIGVIHLRDRKGEANMSLTTLRIVEYGFECDNPQCNDWETLHTGDIVDDIVVHNIQTAFKAAKYHRVKGKTYCDKCFRNINGRK